MKKKIWWIAGLLLLAGMMLCVASAAAAGFDWRGLSTVSLVTKTHPIDQAFSAIAVEGGEANVHLLPAGDGECRAVCTQSENGSLTYAVSVSDGVLTLRPNDRRHWYEHVGFFFGSMEVELYLPEADYRRLTVRTSSGSIHIPAEFSFDEVQVESASGRGNVPRTVTGGTCEITTASGNIDLSIQ